MSTLVLEMAVFVAGLCIGSFLNVCIHRIPKSQSIVFPGSMCPVCQYKLRFYDNIPVLSYLWLKGRCRNCSTAISLRYPLVELLGGLAAWCVLIRYGLTLPAAVHFVFIAVLIVITFIDLDQRIIPDVISLPGIPFFGITGVFSGSIAWLDSLLGIVVGGGCLLLVAWVYHLLTGKEGMGGGDIKLLAMIGALTGWQGVFFTIFVSSATGTLVGLAEMIRTRKNMKLAIPFGPFLAFGAVIYIFFGRSLIRWYLNLF